jgi:hypothetical protein
VPGPGLAGRRQRHRWPGRGAVSAAAAAWLDSLA